MRAEHTRKQFYRTLSIRGTHFRPCSASGKMLTLFTCKSMLSIRGTNFTAGWAYAEWISSLAEHLTRKCLKVEYLGRIEYDFQKSRVTGPRDHKVSVSAKKCKKKFHACVPWKKKSSVPDPWHFATDPNPNLWLTDPDTDPALFFSDLQDANKNNFNFNFLFAFYFMKVHLHHSSKICRSQKEVTKQ